jgi:hypothetical protein
MYSDCAFVLDVLDAAPAGTQLCYTALTFISSIHVVSCLVQAHNVYFFFVTSVYCLTGSDAKQKMGRSNNFFTGTC